MDEKKEELVNIEKVKAKLRVKYPWFEDVIANLSFEPNSSMPTAATNGQTVYYNPTFINGLEMDEKVFVFAHEVCHVAFNHILRSEGKDHKLWNIATDSVINAFLQKDGLKMVEGGVDIPEAIEHDAESMYQKLLEEQEKQEQQRQKKEQTSTDSGDGKQNQENQQPDSSGSDGQQRNDEEKQSEDVGHDSHSLWEEAIKEKHRQEQEEQQSDSNNEDKEKESNTHGKNQEQAIDEREIFEKNKEEKKERLKKLQESLVQQSLSTSSHTNSEEIQVGNVGEASALIDWKKLLTDATKIDVDWSYRNATIRNGVISPHLETQPQPEAEILLDTSGSVDPELLRNFLRECKSILSTSKVKVGCFDRKFYGFKPINSAKDIENMTFQGGGGTDFDLAVNSFTRSASNRIIFTDGWADMPKKRVNAIWVVFGGRQINPPGGKVIQISDEQLRKLYGFTMKDKEDEMGR